MVGLRVLSAIRNMDHPDLVMAAVEQHGAAVPPATEPVKRRRRVHTVKLLVKLTDQQTERIDTQAAARDMTRSTFVTEVLDAFIPVESRGTER